MNKAVKFKDGNTSVTVLVFKPQILVKITVITQTPDFRDFLIPAFLPTTHYWL